MEGTTLRMKTAIVIGAGLAGLTTAIYLANNGYKVDVLEKNRQVGGKLQQRQVNGYTFDLGPSTITMKSVFQSVFSDCGRRMEDYVQFEHVESGTTNYFANHHVVQFSTNIEKVESMIAKYSVTDANKYREFLYASKKLFETAEKHFLNRAMIGWKSTLDVSLITNFLKIHPFTAYQKWLNQFFTHPNTLAMFGRYATYVGSSPYKAPAIFGMMGHIEGNLGVYRVKGGTFQIALAFKKLAEELGVTFHFDTEVIDLEKKSDEIVSVRTNNSRYTADTIVCNMDALTFYHKWLQDDPTFRKIKHIEPSLSGFAILLGIKKRYSMLKHHQVFFPANYQDEFKEIFIDKQMVTKPTIYVCYSGYEDDSVIPNMDSSNLFILVNAPALTSEQDWNTNKERYKSEIIAELERRGLHDLSEHIEYEEIMTPADLYTHTEAFRGSIYGLSSNNWKQAFFRLPNKSKKYNNLWFVGGSVHPGGGTPIVVKSGQVTARAIVNE
jgi:diapolycopene oxygenase